MNGAQKLLESLLQLGVDTCFTNPGTSEMQFVAALEREPRMRGVLALFEGVATGAADGYARIAGKPASTLLHLGPGLGNGFANLHNARRARVPIINIVGDHATYHRAYDAPLTSDIEAVAAAVSSWVRTSRAAGEIASDIADAFIAATTAPGSIATLVVPTDVAWGPAGGSQVPPVQVPVAAAPTKDAVAAIARILRAGEPAALLMNGAALSAPGLALAGKVHAATGARLLSDFFITLKARGAGRVDVTPVAYPVDQALQQLADLRHIITIGTVAPVAFFAYPGFPSAMAPEQCRVHSLAAPGEDLVAALAALVDALDADAVPVVAGDLVIAPLPDGALTPEAIGGALAHLMPENAIVVNEAVSGAVPIPTLTRHARPHDWMDVTGGSVGGGLPLALGAAIAAPERRVIALEGDGSAMYTMQALWSMVREGCNVSVVLFNNRGYSILRWELGKIAPDGAGARADAVLDLGNPDMDWVSIATGLGMPACRATSAGEFNTALARSLATPGPTLIEAIL